MFTYYNSMKINFKTSNGHILIPVIITGEAGVYEGRMMLDTGASMTVIPSSVAVGTGRENLANIFEKRTFSTAQGSMTCPIVKRKISIGEIDKVQPIAVNLQEETYLLGVDFFEDKNYMIDSQANCIYVWNK